MARLVKNVQKTKDLVINSTIKNANTTQVYILRGLWFQLDARWYS